MHKMRAVASLRVAAVLLVLLGAGAAAATNGVGDAGEEASADLADSTSGAAAAVPLLASVPFLVTALLAAPER